MIEIILDASQLEVFEACPRKWYYDHIANLATLRSRQAFNIGSYYHEVLAHFYSNFYKIPDFNERLRSALAFARNEPLLRKFKILKAEDQKFHHQRLLDYFFANMSEDEHLSPLLVNGETAIEKGFSWLLYEDVERRYILEGKIDFIGQGQPYGLFVMDHKTQSRLDDRWPFNHQVCNYLSFTKAEYFIYNYIGLQAKLPPNGIRRELYRPPEGMLDQWKKEVKISFDQMYDYIKYSRDTTRPEERSLPRRRTACDNSKYGLCQFHKLCSVPECSKWEPVVLSHFKEKEERWRAWS